MKRNQRAGMIFLSLVSLFILSSCGEKETEFACMVDLMVGVAEYSSDNGESWEEAVIGLELTEGSRVKTGDDSYCDLLIPGRGVLRVDASTEIALGVMANGNQRFDLEEGSVAVNITQDLEEDEVFEVETASAIAAVRGTRFQIENKQGKSSVRVLEGVVSARRNVNLEGITNESVRAELEESMEVEVSSYEELEYTEEENAEIEFEAVVLGNEVAAEISSNEAAQLSDIDALTEFTAEVETKNNGRKAEVQNREELDASFTDLSEDAVNERLNHPPARIRVSESTDENTDEETVEADGQSDDTVSGSGNASANASSQSENASSSRGESESVRQDQSQPRENERPQGGQENQGGQSSSDAINDLINAFVQESQNAARDAERSQRDAQQGGRR